jgi:hypothetical protein
VRQTLAPGPLSKHEPITLEYSIDCPSAGIVRFLRECGLNWPVHQGFFAAVFFVREAVELPILPAVIVPRGGSAMTKRESNVPPPGVHRLYQPGSGSELLRFA